MSIHNSLYTTLAKLSTCADNCGIRRNNVSESSSQSENRQCRCPRSWPAQRWQATALATVSSQAGRAARAASVPAAAAPAPARARAARPSPVPAPPAFAAASGFPSRLLRDTISHFGGHLSIYFFLQLYRRAACLLS